jgi:hypothetical protein
VDQCDHVKGSVLQESMIYLYTRNPSLNALLLLPYDVHDSWCTAAP